MALDYYTWKHDDESEGVKVAWEVVRIDPDGEDDVVLESGMAESQEKAMEQVKAALRRH